jgi:hypothetical protein
MKLTKAQMETLVEVERGGDIGMHTVPWYPPAKKLVEYGLAQWRDGKDYLVITPAGLSALTGSQS